MTWPYKGIWAEFGVRLLDTTTGPEFHCGIEYGTHKEHITIKGFSRDEFISLCERFFDAVEKAAKS